MKRRDVSVPHDGSKPFTVAGDLPKVAPAVVLPPLTAVVTPNAPPKVSDSAGAVWPPTAQQKNRPAADERCTVLRVEC